MPDAYVDADVFVRLISGDVPSKQEASRLLLSRALDGEVTLHVAASTIAEIVHVLTSPNLYKMPRTVAAVAVRALAELPYLHVENRSTVLRALDLLPAAGKFGDAMLVAVMEREGIGTVYAYDRGYDRISGVTRLEP